MTTELTYDQCKQAAKERRRVWLDDGREARLYYWARHSPKGCKVHLAGRHVWVPSTSIVAIEGIGPVTPM